MSHSPIVNAASEIVDPLVAQVPSPVLEDVLDGGDGEHEDDGEHGDLLAEGVDRGHPVQEDDEEEVEVGESVKLLEEVLREEAEHRVLGGADVVVEVGAVRVVGGGSGVRGEGMVGD